MFLIELTRVSWTGLAGVGEAWAPPVATPMIINQNKTHHFYEDEYLAQ